MVHLPEGIFLVAHHLNYIADIVLELKADLTKIKAEVKYLKNQLIVVHLSLINKVRHSGESTSSISIHFSINILSKIQKIKITSFTRYKNPKRSGRKIW